MEMFQAGSVTPSFSFHYSTAKSESFDKLANDFEDKLGFGEVEPNGSDKQPESVEQEPQLEEEEDDGREEEGDSDFEFARLDPGGSPVSAEDVFDNGQIRPFFPLFNRELVFGDADPDDPSLSPSFLRSPMRKVFAEAGVGGADELRGAYCEWKEGIVEETPPSPGSCRKSNSTGSSKLWRFRDLLPRSNSDGRDAIVMLSPPADIKPSDRGVEKAKRSTEKAVQRKEAKKEKDKGKGKAAAAPSAHARHYVKGRAAKDSERRKSYLPYRQNLLGLGFFTSVNGMSKNVHPF